MPNEDRTSDSRRDRLLEKDDNTKSSLKWTSVEYHDEYIIRYTKQGDKLPLSTFAFTVGEPCMHNMYQVSSYYYPTEIQRT